MSAPLLLFLNIFLKRYERAIERKVLFYLLFLFCIHGYLHYVERGSAEIPTGTNREFPVIATELSPFLTAGIMVEPLSAAIKSFWGR